VLIAVGFGLLAAFLFAASASFQQRAAHHGKRPNGGRPGNGRDPRRTDTFVGLWRLIRRLLREPLWLIGWATNLVGFFMQAVALQFGSVALVQPLLVTQLLFALPMAAAWDRRRPGLRDWLSAGAISAGLAVFLAVRDVAPVADQPQRGRLILACLIAAAAVLVILLVTVGMPRLVRATMFAIGAGLCFAISAAMIKLTSDDLLNRGFAATAKDWPGYVLALSTAAGLLIEQGAFAGGSLPAAVAAMSITNPIASYLLGVFAFGAVPPETPGALAALAVSGALISIGAVGLAHSPLVKTDANDDSDVLTQAGSGTLRPS
jgi:drug/metabolite transporter (DMT)-like permease